jgi:hypothetical protein
MLGILGRPRRLRIPRMLRILRIPRRMRMV